MSNHLQRVLFREVTTLYTISEMLECGHRFESLALLSDPLVAKQHDCPKCAQATAFPQQKKPCASDSRERKDEIA